MAVHRERRRGISFRTMRERDVTSLTLSGLLAPPDPQVRYASQRPLHRVLAFIGRSIDDVVNDPFAKNQVYGYYKLLRQVERAGEVRDLERQWNPTA
jgi:hypothetical protein